MEIQDIMGLENKDYQRAPVILIDDELAGILICWWIYGQGDCWRYHTKFMDVRKDCRNNGIARELARAVDKSDFIDGKIFHAGLLSENGRNYLQNIMKEEMGAENYAYIPCWFYFMKKPEEPGIYDIRGNKMEKIENFLKWSEDPVFF